MSRLHDRYLDAVRAWKAEGRTAGEIDQLSIDFFYSEILNAIRPTTLSGHFESIRSAVTKDVAETVMRGKTPP